MYKPLFCNLMANAVGQFWKEWGSILPVTNPLLNVVIMQFLLRLVVISHAPTYDVSQQVQSDSDTLWESTLQLS
jgi:hypothetical protein